MNSEIFDKWTSVLANVGVLIGLAIVIVELAQNTRAIESEVAWARLASATEIQNRIIDDPEFAEILFRVNSLESDEIDIANSLELQRVARHIITNFLYYETRYITQTTDSERFILRANILASIDSPFSKDVVTSFNVRNANARNPGFREFLSEILSESTVNN